MKKTITRMVMLSLLFFAVSANGQLPCATPGPLTLLELTPTTARVSLTTGVGDYNSGWFNVVVSTTPLADPRTATGTNIVYRDLVQSGFPLSGLTENTKYYTYVQTNCETADNYNGFSAWVRDSITTPCYAVGLPIQANFDQTAAMPDCWRSAGSGKVLTNNLIYYGTSGRSMRLLSTTTTDAYLISPPIDALANNLEITFKAYGEAGTEFRVGILYDFADLTTMQEVYRFNIEATNKWTEYNTITPTSSISAQPNAFVVIYLPAGERQIIYLDDIDIHVKPTCPRPQGFEITNITDKTVTLKWSETGMANSWRVRYITGTDTAYATAGTNNQYVLTGLTQSTEYKVSVAADCGGSYIAPLTFATMQTPATLPYTCGFEIPADNSLWALLGGDQANKWFIGSASSAVNSGSNALYISNTTDGSSNLYYNTTSYVWAYRTIALPQAGKYNVSFNWKANGETATQGGADLLRAFLVPENVTLSAGDAQGMNDYVNTTPNGWIDVTTGDNGIGILNKQTAWQKVDVDIDIANAGNYNLVFFWKNNNATANQPPAAIDNISVKKSTCLQPQNIAINNIKDVQADVSWVVGGTETNWAVRVMQGTNIVWSKIVTGNPTTTVNAGLQPITNYSVQVRSICGVGDTSLWTTAVAFKTICSTFPMPFTENFNTLTSGIPACWDNSTGDATANYKWNYFKPGVTGACVRYDSYLSIIGRVNVLKTPMISVSKANPILSFMYKNPTGGDFTVQYAVNGDTAFTDIATGLTGKANWTQATYTLPVAAGTTVQIAFKGTSNSGDANSYIYLDDVSVSALKAPQSLTLSNITPSQVTATITDDTNNAWEYVVGVAGFNPNTATVRSSSNKSEIFSTLQPLTAYDVYVRASNGADKSGWLVASFTTLQVAASIPYSTGFEDTDDLNWVLANGSQVNKWFIGSATANTGSKSLYISDAANGSTNNYSGGETSYVYAYRTLNLSVGTYNFSFDWKANGESNYDLLRAFLVPVNLVSPVAGDANGMSSSTNGNPSGWIDISSNNNVPTILNGQSAWQSVYSEIVITTAGYYHLVFFWKNNTTTNNQPPAAVDNVSVKKITCDLPHNVRAINVTTTQAKILWTNYASSPLGYNVVVVPAGTALNNSIIAANGKYSSDTTLIVNTLNTSTKYDVYVRTICGVSDTSKWSTPFRFTTLCAPFTTTYTETFDSYSADIGDPAIPPKTYPNHLLPSCWTFSNLSPSSSMTPLVFLTNNKTYAVTGNSLLFKNVNTSPPLYAALPDFDKPINNLVLTFTYKNEGINANNGNFEVGVMTDPSNPSTFSLVKSMPQVATFTQVEIDLNYYSLPPGARNIAFKYIGGDGSNFFASIDNVSVKYSTCDRPQSISLAEVSITSAVVKITDDVNTSWEFAFGATGFNPNTATNNRITSNDTIHYNNLQMNTFYDVYVRAVCSGTVSGKSEWRGPLKFKTECVPTRPPYTESFESTYGCWQMQINIGGSASTSTAYFKDGSKSLLVSNMSAVSPNMDVVQLANYQVTGFAYSTSDSARFTIGVTTDPSEIAAYAPIAEVMIPTKNQWIDFGTTFDTLNSVLMSDVAASKYVVLYFPTSKPIYIDYVTIDSISSCLKPTNLRVSNITDTKADVTWRKVNNEAKWQVQVMQGTNIVWSDIVINNPSVTVPNLTKNTDYTVRIRAICGAADSSSWTLPYTFTTTCGLFQLPFYENFDFYKKDIVTTTSVPGTYPNHFMPDCWIFAQSASSGVFPQAFLSSNSSYTAGAGNYLILKSNSNATPAFAILPEFDTPIDSLILSFTYRMYIINTGSMQVGVLTDPTDTASFVTLKNLPIVSSTPTTITTVDFTNIAVPTGARNVAFRFVGTTTNSEQNVGSIDNIVVNKLTTCVAPTSFVVDNILGKSVDIIINDKINNAWEVSIVLNGHSPSNTDITSITGTATIPGLSGSTSYDAYLRASCGKQKSVWIGPVPFTTPCVPFSLPYYTDFSEYSGSGVSSNASPPTNYPNHLMPTCWNFLNMSATNGTYPQAFITKYSLFVVSSGNCLFMRSTNKDLPFYAVLPEFEKPIDSLTISFAYKCTDVNVGTGTFSLGVMTNPKDVSTFTVLESYPRSATTTTVEHNFAFDKLPPGAKNIAIKYVGGTMNANYFGIDNVSVVKNPSCMPPEIIVNNISDTQAQVNFGSAGNKWQMQVLKGTSIVSTSIETTNPATVNNLLPATDYTVKARTICVAGDTSAWSSAYKFKTNCALWSLATPYPQNFDSYTQDIVTSGNNPPSTYPNNFMPPCWIFPARSTSSGNYPQSFLSNVSGNIAGPGNSLLLRTSPGVYAIAAMPEFDASIYSLKLKFAYRLYIAGSYGDMQVGVMTDPTDTATFVLLKSLPLTATRTMAELDFNYNIVPANARNIAFRFGGPAYTGTAGFSPASIDEITVTKLDCPVPHFTLNNIFQTSVGVVIDDHVNTQWEVTAVPAGSSIPTSGDTVVTYTNSTVSGLLPATKYDIYMRAVCTNGGTSAWAAPITFTTMCAPIDPPYSEDFESYNQNLPVDYETPTTYPNNIMPTCWTFPGRNATSQSFTANYANYAAGTGIYLVLKTSNANISTSAYAALPEFKTSMDSLLLTFNYRNYSATDAAYGTLQVGVMSDPSDPSSFVLVKSLPLTTAKTKVECDFNYSGIPANAKVIAFRMIGYTVTSSYRPTSIDDVSVVKLACPRPHIDLTNITMSSADVVIDDNSNHQWEISVVPQGALPTESGNPIVTDTIYHYSGLQVSTSYDVYVRAICGTGTGSWAGPIGFTTTQNTAPLPYIHGFEDAVENDEWILVNGNQSNKWVIGYIDGAVANTAGPVKDGDNALYISYAPDGSVYNYNTNESYVWAYRTLALRDTIYNISFNWKANGQGNYDLLRAFLVPDDVNLQAGNAAGMTSAVNTTPAGWIDATTGSATVGLLQQKSDWQTVNNDVTITKAGLYKLAFFWKNNADATKNYPPAAIDNIVFRKKNCFKVENVLDTVNRSIPYYMGYGFNESMDNLRNGVNTLSRTELSTFDSVCDTKYNLQLFVVAPVQKVVSDMHCGTLPYTKNGFNIPAPETRTYKRTMYGAGALGADSTIILNLAIQDLQPVTIDTTVCDSKGYYFGGYTIKVSGTYADTIPSVLGCDSIINLNLTVLPTRDTFAVTICAGKSYLFGDSTYKATGVYEQKGLFNVLGCDSTSVLDLTVLDPIVTNFNEAICQGESFTGHGWVNLKVPGTFTELYKTALGCDSTVNLTLDVYRKDTIPDNLKITTDDLPYPYNAYYTIPSGTQIGNYQQYVPAGVNIYGCDSTVNLTLKVTPPSGFDDLYSNSIKMYPNPIKVGSEVTIDCNIPESDRQDIVVEVFNVIGEKIYSVRPNVYPIKVKAFDASGIYVVRIRGAKLHYEGKIVVKE